MTEVAQLILTIKRELKRQGLTYRDVAQSLHLSEASVKRLFASNRFTVARLVDLGRLLGYTLAELVQKAQAAASELRTLGQAQEAKLVADPKLLLTAVCLLNHWKLTDIVARYRLTEAECVSRALVLDRMGVIELLPGNRVRLKVSRDFDWRPEGAIREYFSNQGQGEFLDSGFLADTEVHAFAQGMLTGAARAQLIAELRRLRTRLAVLHEESLAMPLAQRHGIGLLLAMREWEPEAFVALRRVDERRSPRAPTRREPR